MILANKSVAEKRKQLRTALDSGKLLRVPGAYNPLVAKLVEKIGFDAVYVSGGVMANDLGMPDIGLTTLTEITQRTAQIAKVTNLPTIIDIDTGFGETLNVFRTVQELEYHGISGCHLEDQISQKRCGHLDNKTLISTQEMAQKINIAVRAKTDENFLIIARTDAKQSEGIDKAIDRAKAYVDAGAEMIFPEALHSEKEFEQFRKAIDVPLLANMTEFGKSKLLTTEQLENLGYNLVLYPVTTQRLALGAVTRGLEEILHSGSQESVVSEMQTRQELYDLIEYESYNDLDQSVYNFSLSNK